MKTVDGVVFRFVKKWNELTEYWANENVALCPRKWLMPPNALEEELFPLAETLLTLTKEQAKKDYFPFVRKVRLENAGPNMMIRGAMENIDNRCRRKCKFCTFTADQSLNNPNYKQVWATMDQIVTAGERAHAAGIKDSLFLQSGEFPDTVLSVREAMKVLKRQYPHDFNNIVLNLGKLDCRANVVNMYKEMHDAGAFGYLMKIEAADSVLGEIARGEPASKRVEHMFLVRQAGLELGSGNIFGIPGQNVRHRIFDLIFHGRAAVKKMESSSPFTPSDGLPPGWRDAPPGDFWGTLLYLNMLRIAFPEARIAATSNLVKGAVSEDPDWKGMSAQGIALSTGGPNGITIKFNSEEGMLGDGLYINDWEKRVIVDINTAWRLHEETGMGFDCDLVGPQPAPIENRTLVTIAATIA